MYKGLENTLFLILGDDPLYIILRGEIIISPLHPIPTLALLLLCTLSLSPRLCLAGPRRNFFLFSTPGVTPPPPLLDRRSWCMLLPGGVGIGLGDVSLSYESDLEGVGRRIMGISDRPGEPGLLRSPL